MMTGSLLDLRRFRQGQQLLHCVWRLLAEFWAAHGEEGHRLGCGGLSLGRMSRRFTLERHLVKLVLFGDDFKVVPVLLDLSHLKS